MDDPDSVNIGDHYHQQGQSNDLLKLILAAVLGYGGATWLANQDKPEPTPAPPVVDTTDRVNEYELSIGTDEVNE